MRRYLVQRLLLTLLCVLGISMMVFLALRLLKGDLATALLGQAGVTGAWNKLADPEDLAAFREALGLNDPLPIQYAKWLWLVLHGQFGNSAYTSTPVVTEIGKTLPVTVELAIFATILAWIMGVPAGLISALKQDTAVDNILRMFSIVGLSVPAMWLGALLITLPAIWFRWTPLRPYVSLLQDPVANIRAMFWPAFTLAVGMAAPLMRLTRGMAIEVFLSEYIRTARAKGLAERVVLFRHALRNSLVPVVSASGVQFGALLGGALIIENLFSLPGLGRLLVRGIFYRDYAVVQAGVLLIALMFSMINLVTDIAYGCLDPRVRYT